MTSKPSRLGKGLAALLGEASAGTGMTKFISVEALRPGRFQPRLEVSAESLDELTQSIRARGVLQPLLARADAKAEGEYELIAGERRWRAARAAGLNEVPVFVLALDDTEAMAAALVENLQRADLNGIEEASGYKRLLEQHGITQEAVAKAVGKSRSHIANTLRLLSLPPDVQTEVRAGRLSAGHARALVGLPDPASAARRVIADGLTVRQTEAARHPVDEGPHGRDPDIADLERRLGEQTGLKVNIRVRGGRGAVVVRFQTLDQLDGVIMLLEGRR